MTQRPNDPITLSPAIVRAAAVQMDVRIGENEANLARVLERLAEAAHHGAQLVVFPECCLSGYCFDSLDDARPYAERAGRRNSSPGIGSFKEGCYTHGVTGVLGFLEERQSPGECCNSAQYVSPSEESVIWSFVYRKTHLPTLGVDRFVSPGEEIGVYPAPFGKVGVLICYDIRFPEAARVLGLQRADIIALPTNWPEGAESSPDFITRARAWENRVFIVAANRVGVERGRRFIGRSQIVAPTGEIMAEAGPEEETILYADLDLSLARQKRIVYQPGAWELDITGDRRPELYGDLTTEAQRHREGRGVNG